MLSNAAKLYFPKLAYSTNVVINDKPTSVYRLDWTRKELKCAKGTQELPIEEETIAKSLFALPDSYIKEIRRLSWSSVAEWNQIRLLPDAMKLIYLRPAAEMIRASFLLLADCILDPETNFFDRSLQREFVHSVLLKKFWINQVRKEFETEFNKNYV